VRNGCDSPCPRCNHRNEPQSNLAEPLQALAQFYRALNTRDMSLMEQNWDNTREPAMDNPLGGIKRGWAEIETVYERLFRVDRTYHFEFYDYSLHRFGEVFYVVGRERGQVSKMGNELDMKIRTTRVFRFDGQRWRQVHHHGSIEDPQLLAAYQAATR
jgi:ketosteroid isomerase-like protein